ncbi:MAG: hypothetical protein ACE5HV_09550, partial [Acidobacteriota bacterium]
MDLRKRLSFSAAIVALVSALAACAAQPAEAPASKTSPEPVAAAAEPAPAPVPQEPAEPQAEPQAPQQPELVGDIRLSDENFDWGQITDRSSPAPYTWTVRVTNDTTQTLDITVKFDFLDDNDRIIKTERKTIRLAPAEKKKINENGTMKYEDANRVYSFQATYEQWKIVE